MTTGATGQLGLALPVQGELSGTWGDTVNNGLTQYTNIAIAGTLTLTGDGAVTLTNTTGDASASNITSSLTGAGTITAQFAIVKIAGTLTTTKIVTFGSVSLAPYSKTFLVVNAATGGTVTFKAYGQTGVSIAVGESALLYYNGTDMVKVSGTSAVSSFTAGTTGFTPSTATTGAVTLAGTLATANGGTNLTSFTSGGAVYATSTSALTTGTLPLASGGTNATTAPAANANLQTYTTTATAAGTTTLTNTSTYYQYFTGSTTQTIQMPVTSTLSLGWSFHIANNSSGNLTLNSSGANAIGTVLPGTTVHITCIDTTVTTAAGWDFGTTDFGTVTGTGSVVLATSPTLVTPALGTPSSGNLGSCTVDGTNSVGFLNIPQNAQTGNYTLVLADSGKHIYHAVAAGAATYTIPANGSVAYAIGTAITFINLSTTSISIAITTDTMYLSSAGTTGTRTLAQYGSATAIKVTSTVWLISGSGLT